jgi:hypothetical protein
MPFEPRLMKPEESDLDEAQLDELIASTLLREDESGLPADLGELASQLRADSAFLGTCYPATHSAYPATRATAEPVELQPATAPSAPASVPSMRPYWLAGTMLSALLAVGAAWWLAGPGGRPELPVDSSAVAKETAPSAEIAERSPLEVALRTREAAIGIAELPAATTDISAPAALRDLTGPELEGLLDLLETQSLDTPSQGKPRLSI